MKRSHCHRAIRNIININNNLIGVIYESCHLTCEVLDKNTSAKTLNEIGMFNYISCFGDGKIVKVSGIKIALLNENFEISKEAHFDKFARLIEAINEDLIIISDAETLNFLSFSDRNITYYFTIKSDNVIKGITKIADDQRQLLYAILKAHICDFICDVNMRLYAILCDYMQNRN